MSDEQHGTGGQPPTPEQESPRQRPQAPLEPVHLDDPWLLDRVLSGDAGDEWSSLAELFAAASGPAEPDELNGERGAVQSFMAAREAAAVRREKQRASATGGHGARRVAVVSTLMAGKFAAVTVAGIVTLGAGGMAAAAYTGLLPAPLQDVAHRTIGAPLPDRTTLSAIAPTSPAPTPESTTTTTTRTQRSDPARATTSTVREPTTSTAELCIDWQQKQLASTDPAFTSLTLAAGSTSVGAYCASLSSPTTEPAPEPQATPTIDPTATPSDTSSPTSPPASPSPTTASDQPEPPPMTASDQPTAPATELPATEPTGP